jgi:hypothetical protein
MPRIAVQVQQDIWWEACEAYFVRQYPELHRGSVQ